MKILVPTSGTLGDVRPVLALALGLREAGHTVVLAAPPENEELVKYYECPFSPLGDNFREFAASTPDPSLNPVKATIALRNFSNVQMKRQMNELHQIAEDVDLIIGASIIFGIPTAAELANKPFKFLSFCPGIIPSAHHPSLITRSHNHPKLVNRLSWWFYFRLMNFLFGRSLNQERRKHNLKPVSNIWSHLLEQGVIVASDAAIGKVPDDVKAPYSQTGYLHLATKDVLPSEVENFLLAGDPPVFIGFGSMGTENWKETIGIMVNSVRSLNRRIILSTGWAHIDDNLSDKDIINVDQVPHELLFPRVAAVVHHGGAGTTSTAARAGVPQIIMPHMSDQYYYASRVWKNGLGPAPIMRKELNEKLMNQALNYCFENHEIQRNVKEMRDELFNTNPLEETVKIVEKMYV
ncbi:glycosyltransferase [Thermodesulfobacteriota bacterium]